MRRAAQLWTELVQERFDVIEAGSRTGVVLGLGFAHLGDEQLSAEQAELLLVALVSVWADDVSRPAGPLQHDRRLVALLDLVDNVGHALPKL